MDIHTRKFRHVLFWLVIESALINSWLLYKATRENANLAVEYSFFTFRKSIALALVAEWENMVCRPITPALQSPHKILQRTNYVRTHFKTETRREDTRFTSEDKHFSHLARIPPAPDSKWKHQLRCVQCKISKTIWMGSECRFIPLCKDGCYVNYHSKWKGKIEFFCCIGASSSAEDVALPLFRTVLLRLQLLLVVKKLSFDMCFEVIYNFEHGNFSITTCFDTLKLGSLIWRLKRAFFWVLGKNSLTLKSQITLSAIMQNKLLWWSLHTLGGGTQTPSKLPLHDCSQKKLLASQTPFFVLRGGRTFTG
jgi:hypothetical protein